jgi:hypothetical protein
LVHGTGVLYACHHWEKPTLDRFKAASPQFAAMQKLAMNFRAILFSADPAPIGCVERLWPASHLVIRPVVDA